MAVARLEQVAQVTTFAPEIEAGSFVEELQGAVGEGATVHGSPNFYCPGWSEITIQHCAANKGAAIPALLAASGISGAEVVACGDHLNDLPLFAQATRSVAPANAHPAVLAVATEIVGPNAEDGIVRHLLERHCSSGDPAGSML